MGIWKRLVGGGEETITRARRPQRLADELGAPPLEGIDWLGRVPGPRPPLLLRAIVALSRVFLFGICRLRLEVTGRERLPDGGYVAIVALHRSWIDPLLVVAALPPEPRVWFMGSGPSTFDRPWKERLLRRTGGLLPVWRGGTDISVHERSARAVIDAGAVLALFAEGRIGGRPDAPASMRLGAALLGLRTNAPIVPIAISGAEELYRGKRLCVDILPTMTAEEVLGHDWHATAPAGSRDELRAARRLTEALSARIAEAVAESYPATIDPPHHPHRWRWLNELLR